MLMQPHSQEEEERHNLDVNVLCLFCFRGNQSLPSCGILLSGPSGSGKRTVAVATSKRLNLHNFVVNCYNLIGESIAATEARLKNVFQKGLFNDLFFYGEQIYNVVW